MAKAKRKASGRPASKTSPFPGPSLAPRMLEQAAQGWLQSSGASAPIAPPTRLDLDHRLAEALTETLQQLRTEIAELRSRLDRLESRSVDG